MNKGYTLIELLVTIAAIILVLRIAYTGLRPEVLNTPNEQVTPKSYSPKKTVLQILYVSPEGDNAQIIFGDNILPIKLFIPTNCSLTRQAGLIDHGGMASSTPEKEFDLTCK